MWPGLALAALLPRALGAVARPPWHDEYFTSWAATLSWAKLLDALRVDSGPPLPYALVKLLTLSGLAPLPSARLVAVAAGTGAVLLAARAARRAFGAEAGWWAGALLAFHPLAVAWSSEGRAYPLVLLAAAWGWDRLASLARGNGGLMGLGLAVALACWSHALGMLLAATLAVVALSLGRPARGRAVAAIAAGLASHLPWLPVAAHQPPAAIAWMTTFWRALPAWERVVAPLRLLSPVGQFAATLDMPSPPWWIEATGALLVVALFVTGCRREGRPHRAMVGFALPAAALWCLAAVGVPVLYPGRGEVVYLVPLVLLLAVGAAHVQASRAVATAVCLAAVAVTSVSIVGWARRPPTPEQRLAATIRERLPHGGTVVLGGYWRLGLAYHLCDVGGRFRLVNVPAEAATHPGWYDHEVDAPAPAELERLSERLRGQADHTAVVVTPGLDTAVGLRRLAVGLGLRRALAVPGGELLLPPT